MAVLLQQAGYDVTVFTAMPNYPTGRVFPAYRGKLRQVEMMDGIRVIRLGLMPSNSSNLWARGVSLLTFLAAIFCLSGPALVFGRADLVIVSSPPLFSAWMSAFLARCGRKKVLVNISDIWPLTVAEMGALKQGLVFKGLQLIERSLYRMATAVTGQSDEILAHLSSCLTVTKPNFRYRNLQAGKSPTTESVPAITHQSLRIIYAGNLGHAQGMLELCLRTNFKALGASLDIYGSGGEEDALKAKLPLIQDQGVTLHPAIPQKELDVLLVHYEVMLVPLKQPISGAVPSKLFMAVAANMPVIFMAGGEGAQLVATHQLGWVVLPGDYEALAKTITQLTQLSAASWQAIKQPIALARETAFSKTLQDEQFVHFIESLLN